jgi:hemerythrin superfamily protein
MRSPPARSVQVPAPTGGFRMPNPIEKMAAKGAGKIAAVEARAKGLTGVFNKLAEQHKQAAVLLKRAANTDDPAQREELWREIRRELLSHERGELNAVYPALKQEPATRDIAREHNAEVPELEAAIAQIDRAGFTSSEWKPLVQQLTALVTEHANEEENVFFPRAQEALGKEKAAKLEEPFIAAKKRAADSID